MNYELQRVQRLLTDYSSSGRRRHHGRDREQWADAMDEMRRLQQDLRKSDELNAKLKADLVNVKQAVRDATIFAKSLIDDVRQQRLRGSGDAAIPVDLEGIIPPGNWAGVRIPSQMGSADHSDVRSGAALQCKTEIQQEDINTVEMQVLIAPTGLKGIDSVKGVGGVGGVPAVDGLDGGERS